MVPPQGIPLGFVQVPAGPFSMGTCEEAIPDLMQRFGAFVLRAPQRSEQTPVDSCQDASVAFLKEPP